MAVSAMRRRAILALPATGGTPVGRTGKMPVPRYSAVESALGRVALGSNVAWPRRPYQETHVAARYSTTMMSCSSSRSIRRRTWPLR